ncbi:MAG: DNA-binding protein [Synergistetes bacterium]|nr:MAG: Uncharacterized protein XD52_1149 [bacterium 42_11]MBC7331470.1 DNA-binding protein [Synergistota bacterium]MDK2871193.1 uncharacterized protein [bacterium]
MTGLRFSSVDSKAGRTIVGRLLPGTDLIEGILALCKEHNINFGSIDVVLGSLRKFTFVYPIRDESKKMGVRYCDPVVIEGPIELLCGGGLIGVNRNGEKAVHLHLVVSDREGKVYGGHVVGGNPVLVTVELVLRELEGVSIVREEDEETGFPLFKFKNIV